MVLADAKIALVLPTLGIKGNLVYWGPILDSFSKLCRELRVFTYEFAGVLERESYTIQKCGDYVRMFRPTETGYPKGFGFVAPTITKRLLEFRPNVILSSEFGLSSVYSLMSSRLTSSRYVQLVESRPIISGGRLFEIPRLAFRKLICGLSDCILTNNEAGFDYLTITLRAPRRKILQRPYLVSQVNGRPRTQSRPPQTGSIRFLYVGQLVERKGVWSLMHACSILQERHSNSFSLTIVGDGPLRSELEAFSRRRGLERQIQFAGSIQYEALGVEYEAASVFVFPTLADYRALVPFEALSTGLPIICSAGNGGVQEVVSEGQNGFCFSPGCHDELADLMSRFIAQPALVDRFSARSREMSEGFTVDRAVEGLKEACDRVLSSLSPQRC